MGQGVLTEKLCRQCDKKVETYWELLFCDKNPNGVTMGKECKDHGNEIDGTTTCEDDYCHPSEEVIVKLSELTDENTEKIEYIRTHEVNERCGECHQFMECMG